MADNTPIEWCDATVNAINGCSLASPGCTNCYAMKLAGTRLKNHPSRQGLTIDTKTGPVWSGAVRLHEPALLQPLRWQRPRTIFWNAHGDTFHEAVPDEWLDRMFAVISLAHWHRHLVLSKRTDRMRGYFSSPDVVHRIDRAQSSLFSRHCRKSRHSHQMRRPAWNWPLQNLWLGTSIEDRQRLEERAENLKFTPAAGHFWSAEPLIGDLGQIPSDLFPDGVIAGGESGPRPMHPDWARSLRDQCAAAGVDFHFKQWGSWVPLQSDGDGYWPTNAAGCIRLTVDGRRADDGYPMQRVGKKHAGRILDGVTHDALPWRRAA